MKKYGAEFFGTFWLVLGGCGSAVLAAAFPQLGIGFVGVSLAFGLTVLTMAFAIGHISGCHLNPAVSIGLWAGGRFPGKDLLPYIVSQVLGGIAAAGVLYLIASGKAYNDTRQALVDLGLDSETCQRLGIRVHKVSVVWPLEAQTTREFAQGLKEILVVEEKRQIIEYQLKEELYNWPDSKRPRIVGKFDELDGDDAGGEWSVPNPMAHRLLRANADLTPTLIAKALAHRLLKLDLPSDIVARMNAQLQIIESNLASDYLHPEDEKTYNKDIKAVKRLLDYVGELL